MIFFFTIELRGQVTALLSTPSDHLLCLLISVPNPWLMLQLREFCGLFQRTTVSIPMCGSLEG